MGQQESQEEPLIYSGEEARDNGSSGLYARAVRESGGLYMREGSSSGLYREDLGYERELGSLYSRQEYRAETKMPFLHCRNYAKTLSSFAKVTFICWCQD
jgi:hypothetical protein